MANDAENARLASAWLVGAVFEHAREPLRALIREVLTETLAVPRPTPTLTSEQLAQVLGVSAKTIFRLRGEGMPFLPVGDSPRYEVDCDRRSV